MNQHSHKDHIVAAIALPALAAIVPAAARVATLALMTLMTFWVARGAPATAQTDALHVSPGGDVGIGTTPSTKLHVYAGASGGAAFPANTRILIEDDANAFIQFLTTNTKVSGLYFGDPEDIISAVLQWRNLSHTLELKSHVPGGQVAIFSGNNSEAVRIDSSGNVGIGTSAPGGKLDVNGAIFQRGALVHPDFVFEPEYPLETIEDHAAYMWANKHLPAVGSGRYDEEGRSVIELGANSVAMLEELEKAHIYIDQLNTGLKASQAENAELRERLARVEKALGLAGQ